MSPGDAILLDRAEAILQQYSPAAFDGPDFGFPECIEYVRAVEDEEAWKAHIRPSTRSTSRTRRGIPTFASTARREILTENPLTSPGGRPSERLARLRRAGQ